MARDWRVWSAYCDTVAIRSIEGAATLVCHSDLSRAFNDFSGGLRLAEYLSDSAGSA